MPAFNWPDWKPLPLEPDAAPEQAAPPPDPAAMREQKIADDTRVEDALNRFVTARQSALFEAPDAFYRTQGVDAIHAAPGTTQKLDDLRGELMDGLANDNQRQRLGASLDAQTQLTRENMARHVGEQSLAWQRQVAQDRIATLAKEAALHHNDDDLVDTLGHAAATAARAHARVGEGPPGGQAEDAAAATARSGVLGAAIQTRLDSGNTGEAAALFDKLKNQLDPTHAEPLQANIDAAQRFDAAKAYAGQLVPQWTGGSHDEVDAQHAAATRQNQSDNRADPAYQADVQHVLDVQHATQKRGIDGATAQRAQAVTDWLTRTGLNGEPQTSRPPPALWKQLSPDEQAALDKRLVVNARGEVPPVAEGRTPAAASNIGLPGAGAATLGETAKAGAEAASGLISRAAPYVGRAASGVGAAATILLVPRNTQATNIELGDGLRIRSAPGQRTVTIERQVDKGVLGTGVGARWEELPVQAEHATAPDGRSIIAIDPRQLESAIGADAVNRIRQQAGIAMADPPDDPAKPKEEGQAR